MTTPLYRRLLGQRFEELPARVRELHDVTGASVWTGRADVERGRSRLSNLVATLFGLPPAGRDQALEVTFMPDGGTELWTRALRQRGVPLAAVRARRPAQRAGGAEHVRVRARHLGGRHGAQAAGRALPRRAAAAVACAVVFTFESEREGRYHFEVEASLPLLGRIVRYEGWLEKAS